MKGSFNYVMVTQKDGSRVRVAKKQWQAYLSAKAAKKALPKLDWTL